MTRINVTLVKLGIFTIVMGVATAALFMMFAQVRTGATTTYSAVFRDVSSLREGQSVRMAGIRVGTVNRVVLRSDKNVNVDFDADRDITLTTRTRAVIRYLNLTGDRYLDLVEPTGSTEKLAPGSQIPLERTAGALDLDQLLGGLKPVIAGLNPSDVNALTTSLIAIFQDQGDTLDSLSAQTASFTKALADNSATVQSVIDNLRTTLDTMDRDGGQFSDAIDKLQKLASGLADQRDSIAEAIDALDSGTATMADLLSQARPPLAGTVSQLARLAPLLDQDKDRLEGGLKLAPQNYRKLIRTGAYGSFVNYYLCGVAFRVSDMQGRTAVFPFFKQESGRCGEP